MRRQREFTLSVAAHADAGGGGVWEALRLQARGALEQTRRGRLAGEPEPRGAQGRLPGQRDRGRPPAVAAEGGPDRPGRDQSRPPHEHREGPEAAAGQINLPADRRLWNILNSGSIKEYSCGGLFSRPVLPVHPLSLWNTETFSVHLE